MAANYEVRVVEYKTGKGNQIVVTFKNEAFENIMMTNSPYFKLWGKANRLYFLPSTPTGGIKLGDNGTLVIAKSDLLDALRKFIGEYGVMHYDDTTHYYYIDSEEKTVAVVNEGAQTGTVKNQPGSANKYIKKDFTEGPQFTKDTAEKNSTSEETVSIKMPVVTAVMAPQPAVPTLNTLLVNSLVECVLGQKNEAAYEIASIIQKMQAM